MLKDHYMLTSVKGVSDHFIDDTNKAFVEKITEQVLVI